MITKRRTAGIVAALGGMVLAGSASASAATTRVEFPAVTPAGYTIVESAHITAPAGSETDGSVACPAKGGVQTYPLSGGVRIQSDSVLANVNSSFPAATFWYGEVHNASAAATTFEVYAVCADKPSGYKVVHSALKISEPGTYSGTDVVCPKGTVVTGGGVDFSVGNLLLSMSSSSPPGTTSWFGSVVNAADGTSNYQVFAVCAKYGSKNKYVLSVGAVGTNPVGAQTKFVATCPSGESVLGGGPSWSWPVTPYPDDVAVNTTYPGTGTWINDENNASTMNAQVVGYVICAT